MRKFILTRYLLREHTGPFCFSFAVLTFVFVLDLLFRQLNRLLSKGLPVTTILEFFGCNLAWMMATAVPMAVLTATLMAFGRLAADEEITALHAAGLSLRRLVAPVLAAAAALALMLFWFTDRVLPEFNYRARRLATAITLHKPAIRLEPGVWFGDLPNYRLLATAVAESLAVTKLTNLLVQDLSAPQVQRMIAARAGLMQTDSAARRVTLTLFDGEIQEIDFNELEELRRLSFIKHEFVIFWEDSTAGLLATARTDREQTLAQMRQEVSASEAALAQLQQRLHAVFAGEGLELPAPPGGAPRETLLTALPADLPAERRDRLRGFLQVWSSRQQELQQRVHSLLVEIHKKYAFPAACVVFVLIGAPLGVLARQGGFATSSGLSLIFFLIYWACMIGGERLADRERLPPLLAMWSANLLLGGLGLAALWQVGRGPWTVAPLVHGLRQKISNLRARRQWHRPQPAELPAMPCPAPPAVATSSSPPRQPEVTVPVTPPAQPAVLPQRSPSGSGWPEVRVVLQQLAHRTHAQVVMLCDQDGRPVVQVGNVPPELPESSGAAALGRLAASHMAAAAALFRQLGETQGVRSLLLEGWQHNSYVFSFAGRLILIVITGKQAAVGWVELMAKQALASLRQIALAAAARKARPAAAQRPAPAVMET
ncbi:LptF/LptG family permease [bacterium]|nr:LptF/LptG family permease [bacterium]